MEYKTRAEVPEKDKWDLTKIFKNEEDFYKAIEGIKPLLEDVASFKGKIMASSTNLLNFINAYEDLNREAEKVFMYAKLQGDTDTKNNHYKELSMKVDKMFEEISEKTSFINSEILENDYDKVLSYLKDNKELEKCAFYLEKKFRYKKYVLSKEEEHIISLATNAFGAGHDVFYNFDNADIDLGTIKDEKNNEIELTNSNYIKYMNSKDRRVRQEAFNGMYNYFKKFKNTITAAYNGNIREDFFVSKARGYNSPLEASLYDDNISKDVYTNLIDTVHKNLDTMYDYLALKKKCLGLDEMHMYDIYVDITKDIDMKIPFNDGKKMVFEALSKLGDNYVKDLAKAFDERWIDIYPTPGKKSGAYSWGSYDTYPYLLLNYDETVDSVSTMAHELGHSMHSYYSNNKQNFFNNGYPIFLAEIASTVNEVLLNDYLYHQAKTKDEKIFYLVELLEKIRTTIYRQTMFAEFEMLVHDKYDSGEALTSDLLCDTYYNLNKLYYGDNVVSDDLIRYEWSRIPHFYSAFYVYKYATGLSAALSIATDILAGREDIKEGYLEFLKSGGSDYPLNILKKVDVDMTTTKPIEKALNMFKEKLNELKELID